MRESPHAVWLLSYFKKYDDRMTLPRIRRTGPTIEAREGRQKNVPSRRDGPVSGGRGLW